MQSDGPLPHGVLADVATCTQTSATRISVYHVVPTSVAYCSENAFKRRYSDNKDEHHCSRRTRLGYSRKGNCLLLRKIKTSLLGVNCEILSLPPDGRKVNYINALSTSGSTFLFNARWLPREHRLFSNYQVSLFAVLATAIPVARCIKNAWTNFKILLLTSKRRKNVNVVIFYFNERPQSTINTFIM